MGGGTGESLSRLIDDLWLLASGRFRVTSQENIFHECLAAFETGFISAPFSKDFQRTGKKKIKLSFF